MSALRQRGPSLYAFLELDENATADEIRQHYKRLAFQYHPDKNPNNPEAEEKFKKISRAYVVLSDENKKKLYDEFGDVGLAVGSRIGTEKAKETCGKVKANPCALCIFSLCSILTLCWCCLCCCCCCWCCGKGDCLEGVELVDLSDLEEDKEVVTSQPKIDSENTTL